MSNQKFWIMWEIRYSAYRGVLPCFWGGKLFELGCWLAEGRLTDGSRAQGNPLTHFNLNVVLKPFPLRFAYFSFHIHKDRLLSVSLSKSAVVDSYPLLKRDESTWGVSRWQNPAQGSFFQYGTLGKSYTATGALIPSREETQKVSCR